MASPPRPSTLPTLLASGLVLAAVAVLLGRPLGVCSEVFWGPADPFTHRDFLGAWWLFGAAGDTDGIELWLSRQNWPDGALALRHHIPNPFDGLLLGPLVAEAPVPLWWNLLQLAHHLANLLATVLLARALGLRALPAALAGVLCAATPAMLHEIAGGRTLSGAVWPGLLALVLLLRPRGPVLVRPLLPGLLLALQGLCYAYHAVLIGVLAMILRPLRALPLLGLAGLALLPYRLWLGPVEQALTGHAPPAGYTSLSLSGLLGLEELPPPMVLAPWLLLGLLGPWLGGHGAGALRPRGRARLPRCRAHRRPLPRLRSGPLPWTLAALLALGVALGPELLWSRGGSGPASPLAWLMWAWPALDRMHHPVRAVLFAVPLLSIGLAWGAEGLLHRRAPGLRSPVLLGLVGGVLLTARGDVEAAASFEAGPEPPGMAAARWLAEQPEAGAVVDWGARHAEALPLQLVHRRPILTGFREHGASRRATSRALHERLYGEGQEGLQTEDIEALRAAGYGWILVVERGGAEAVPEGLDLLGEPVFPGVFAL